MNSELIEILLFLESITKEKIILTNHFIKRNKRHNNKIYNKTQLYEELLTNHTPVEISLQNDEKVRIKYKHPFCKNYDFCIVFTRKKDKILLITTYNSKIIKRIGVN
ncbi:hypothetical protein [uncultured Methanosphaera sp.]|uniref:hypothetical protein n=1 Tax=uncultured Methanosphaera sp. TaxID=262501 RepID=UPI0025F0F678|nr:hypothetical protein [uncultured Methanosphaera sp.]